MAYSGKCRIYTIILISIISLSFFSDAFADDEYIPFAFIYSNYSRSPDDSVIASLVSYKSSSRSFLFNKSLFIFDYNANSNSYIIDSDNHINQIFPDSFSWLDNNILFISAKGNDDKRYSLYEFNLKNKSFSLFLASHMGKNIYYSSVSPDRKNVACLEGIKNKNRIIIYDINNKSYKKISNKANFIRPIWFSENELIFAKHNTLYLYNIESRESKYKYNIPKGYKIAYVLYSKYNRYLVVSVYKEIIPVLENQVKLLIINTQGFILEKEFEYFNDTPRFDYYRNNIVLSKQSINYFSNIWLYDIDKESWAEITNGCVNDLMLILIRDKIIFYRMLEGIVKYSISDKKIESTDETNMILNNNTKIEYFLYKRHE